MSLSYRFESGTRLVCRTLRWILSLGISEGCLSIRFLYQFKSKLYLDLASVVNCDQRNFDVNDENSSDSKREKVFRFYSLKFSTISHCRTMFTLLLLLFFISLFIIWFLRWRIYWIGYRWIWCWYRSRWCKFIKCIIWCWWWYNC